MGNSLRWEALWYVDWISVNGETDGDAEGMGDGTAHIGVTHAKSRTDDTATTVTFIYYDEDTGEEVGRKTVNVCRCVMCDCDSFEILGYKMCSCSYFEIDTSTLTFDWDSDNTSQPEVVSFTTDEECIKDITAEVDNTEWFDVSVSEAQNNITVYSNKQNKNTDTITGVITISYKSDGKPCDNKKINLVKKGRPCNCNNFEILGYSSCTCQNFTLSKDNVEWNWNNISPEEIEFEITDDCVDISSIVSAETTDEKVKNHFAVSISNDKITIAPNEENRTASNISGKLDISYSSGNKQDCISSITLTHLNSDCKCEDLIIDKTELNEWEWNDIATEQYINIDASSMCIPFEYLTTGITGTNRTDFNVTSASTGDNKIKITVLPKNYNDSDSDLEATIEINYASVSNPSCPTIKIQLKQKQMECDCDNFEIEGYE